MERNNFLQNCHAHACIIIIITLSNDIYRIGNVLLNSRLFMRSINIKFIFVLLFYQLSFINYGLGLLVTS